MKRPNITPGPWFVTQKSGGPVRIETFTCRRVCTMADTPEDQREANARARAIAAVPALLEALEELVAHDVCRHMHKARAALALAGYTF